MTTARPVIDTLHGVTVADPFRWLEQHEAASTRSWIEEQTLYTRAYFDSLPGRNKIRHRIRELLDVETCDSFRGAGDLYLFRKRLPGREQPAIYMRRGAQGDDELLVDPATRGRQTNFTSLQPLALDASGRFLLYEVKEGGEKAGSLEIVDIQRRCMLPDGLPYGYSRGFTFLADGSGFCYVLEPLAATKVRRRCAYQHVFGKPRQDDRELFALAEGDDRHLYMISDGVNLGFLIYRFGPVTAVDFLLAPIACDGHPVSIVSNAEFMFSPQLQDGRVFAMTDRDAPNRRIVEIGLSNGDTTKWTTIVPERAARLNSFAVVANRVVASYTEETGTHIRTFTFDGSETEEIPQCPEETLRFSVAPGRKDELFLERESFTKPVEVWRYSPVNHKYSLWSRRSSHFASEDYGSERVWYTSKDGVRVPMWLVGRKDVLWSQQVPVIMTSYGGFGTAMTPQFSVFVSYLMECGCLFALPCIRGGSDLGAGWHEEGKRRKRGNSYADFIAAAEWLIESGRTSPDRIGIFGGSNSGLLVAVAMTQRPELFRAVVCMVPLLDMIRYHLFDEADRWQNEYGVADDPEDFRTLIDYSPYHRVRDGVAYPATMIVSGDADQHCNPLHARKMAARLQMANSSDRPILLDYSRFRGHSPVLPLSQRVEALVDRMAFLSNELNLE
jgi:prolyl oligopeptidase